MSKEKKPIIFSIDDDPQVLQSIKNDLRSRYRKDYRIISALSANEALDLLPELKKRGESVALFLSDQRMPEMLGVDFLVEAKKTFEKAKRVLLTAYSDISAAITAINEVNLDYYLTKPWNPPEEKLYPVIDELIEEWQATANYTYAGIKLISRPYDINTHRIKEFLSGNLIPFQNHHFDSAEAKEWQDLYDIQPDQLPTVILEEGEALIQPSIGVIADKIGLHAAAKYELYDVTILGAGPAGLAAAVYGGSEGLDTALVEKLAPGGQAGTSSRIENYLGFPNGVSGSELSRRAYAQAMKFNVDFISPATVTTMTTKDQFKTIKLAEGKEIHTKSLVISTGMEYRTHPAQGVNELTGKGIYYGAATTEAQQCTNKEVYVIGGGNSAGQGAVYISQFAKRVKILIRKPDLTASMSSYLISQIDQIPNIDVCGYTELMEAHGDTQLEEVILRNMTSQTTERVAADALFIFIGTKPNTDWLGDQLLRSDKGFILTGRDASQHPDFNKFWKEKREPMALETTLPGVFAVGDVRFGAMNRVASAVGEGAMSIKMTHDYLATT